MAKFRKRPVVIEAMELVDSPSPEYVEAMHTFLRDCKWGSDQDGIFIETLEGTMRASHGDWIIRGVKGEFYPCKHDIFAATYEPEPNLTPHSKETTNEHH